MVCSMINMDANLQIYFSLSENALVTQPREAVVQKIRMFAALGMYQPRETGDSDFAFFFERTG